MAPVVGAVVGAVSFPPLYRRAVVVLTALLGAVVVVGVSGYDPLPPVILAVAGVGALVQFAWGRPAADRKPG
jgi:hypothetical protein